MEQISIATALIAFNPVHYGSKTPAPPYVVIKPEQDPLARGTVFRIIRHDLPAQLLRLDTDMQAIIAILDGLGTLKTQSEDFNPTVFTGNSDGTISREHTFLMFSKY